jgi:oligosaccharide 4-alpha-D-glucosyltransferase
MLFEKYAKNYPQQRLFHLNRSGYAGTWRYGSFPWSGDVDRSWNGLKAQLPIMIGTGLSGIPTMHSDAGGFAMGQRDPELYRRWIQMAVFSPVFRPHGSVSDPNPDIPQIESEPVFYDEPDKSILRNFVELRYQLMPYNYTLAYEASTQGKPFVRPLFFYNASDSNLSKATDQYMYGDAFLIAPVLEKSATKRKLYLPAGTWYNFWNPTEKLSGARWLDVDVTAATIPVFVKAGSIVPMKPVFDNTENYPDSILIVHYYAADGSQTFKMYEDDGRSATSVSKKQFELIRFQTMKKELHTGMVISSNGGTYKGKPLSRKLELWIHGIQQPKKLRINGKTLTNWTWKDGAVLIPGIQWSGSKITLELK